MSEARWKERPFEDTVELKQVFRSLESASPGEVMRIFDELPIREIRKECLRRMERIYHDDWWRDDLSTWVENRIRDLFDKYDKLWGELIHIYLFRPAGEMQIRAIEFAIEWAETDQRSSAKTEVSKIIADRIRDHSELYWKVPSLMSFLHMLLAEDYTVWVKRAARMIIAAEDTTFLPQLKDISTRYALKEAAAASSPRDTAERLAQAEDSGFFSEVVRILEKMQTAQTPDLNVTLGAFLRKKAGLYGSVSVRLKYPERVTFTHPKPTLENGGVGIELELEPTKPAETNRLLEALKDCTVRWEGEGFLEAKSGEKIWRQNYGLGLEVGFTDLQCRLSTLPRKGNNRFWLTFRYEGGMRPEGLREPGQDILKMAGYIFCE